MRRVLIWKKVSPCSEYDIFRGMDCLQEYKWRSTFNVGNRLWFQGIMSAIDTKENQYEFLSDELTTEAINTEYDFIILPMANIFNSKFRHYLEGFTFDKIKIPIYVIACGAQADNYESLDMLIDDIGDLSKRFISSVYNTGGEFALRGYFTKEFFERLGFPSAVVTGCPSMFQMGSTFVANGSIKNSKPQKPVFNGNVSILKKLMEQYKGSIFIDQDVFWQEL